VAVAVKFQLPMWAMAIIAVVFVVGGFKIWDRLWGHLAHHHHHKDAPAPGTGAPKEEAKVPYRRSSDTLPPIPTNHFAFEHTPLAPSNPPFKPRVRTDTAAPIPTPLMPAGEPKDASAQLPAASVTRPPMKNLRLSRKAGDETNGQQSTS
jgi:hypothetical protein